MVARGDMGRRRRRGYAVLRRVLGQPLPQWWPRTHDNAGPFALVALALVKWLRRIGPASNAPRWPRRMTLVTQGGHISTEPRINERIRVPEVRLVGPAGEQVGIVTINDALRLAQEADLDLVEVAPMARPPVCKLMDYGKFKYESALKARESRKNQAQTVIKEIKLRPKIDPHDYGTKKGHVERFLKQGDKGKVTIMFRGREQSRPELGFKLLQRLAGDIEELGFVESSPKQDGRNMIMVIGPHKRKTEAMAAAKAEKASRASARSTELAARRAESKQAAGQASGPSAPSTPSAPPAATPSSAAQPPVAESTPAQSTTAKPAAAKPAPSARAPAPAKAAPGTEARVSDEASAAATRTASPRPTAPRATPASAARPGPGTGGAAASPRPTAPRGSTGAARPGATRRASDGPVPTPRAVAADKATQATAAPKEPGEADS
jgi:translation initiation factor IF-3